MRAVVCLAAAVLASAQEQPPTFHTGVDLVNVAFSVRDRAGRLVNGLGREDFELYEDGVRQEIRVFSRDQDTPLTVGLVIDRSGSQEGFEEDNIRIAAGFFRRMLREQDQAFVVAFGNRIRQVCGMTNSVERLERALRNMDELYDEAPRIGPRVSRTGGSAVFDAIYWTVAEKLLDTDGRKALIMLGDGRENASRRRFNDTIEMLQSSGVLFYGLDNGGTRRGMKDRNRMPELAEQSGGREFKTGAAPLDEAFAEIERELRTMYAIGYVSSNTRHDGRFRRIEVRPRDRRLVVRARPGYYARVEPEQKTVSGLK
jgi:Ca-activated chloride channel family protein